MLPLPMKKHLKHVALCAPMGVILGIGLLARGTVIGVIAPLVAGLLVMAFVMHWMDQGDDGERTNP